MGAYLSEPNTECVSDDGETEKLRYGSSAMQGWRAGMEDSHNCIPNIGEGTAMFAVYDGHGGAEVAMYCSKYLSDVITSQSAYKDDSISKALQDAFMELDAKLKEAPVIEELRQLAGIEQSMDEADADEASALQEESNLPLGELLARYSYHPSKTRSLRKKLDKSDLLSPMVRKKAPSFNDLPADKKKKQQEEEEEEEKEESDVSKEVSAKNGDDKGAIPLKLDENEEDTKAGDDTEANSEEGAKKGSDEIVVDGNKTDSEDRSKCNGSGSSGSTITNGRLGDENEVDEGDDKDYEDVEDEDDEDEDEDDDDEDDDEDDDDEDDDEDDDDDQQDVFGQKEEPGSDSGCTAVVALIRDKRIIVANAGDSRCVLSRAGTAIDLSVDHKPEDDVELTRIEKAGGKVTADGRVNGGLNLSRAIGDHCYKCSSNLAPADQMISAYPDIQTAELTSDVEFMVIACDGIWNVMTSQEVIDYVQERILGTVDAKTCNLSEICEELFRMCLAPDTSGDGTGCDNMTCIIVQFNHESPDRPVTVATVCTKRKASTDNPTTEDNTKRHRDESQD